MRRPAVLLFVHAHPDDETLATGVSLAHYAAAGHQVHVLTCTLGEQGEVVARDLAQLAADHDDTLGIYRREELRRAMAVLGIQHTVLGTEPGRLSRYRDSGMAGTPSTDHPDAFASADVAEASALVARFIQRIDADVVVTYDEHGGYGHPDHIQAHRVTCAAVASLPERDRPLLYAVLTPHSWAVEDRAWLAEHVPAGTGWHVPGPTEVFPPSVVSDDMVTHEVVAPEVVARQADALRKHHTQVTVGEGCYALSDDVAARLSGREGFALTDPATGEPVAGTGAAGRHTGLLLEDEA